MKRSRAGKGKAAGKGPQAVEPLAGDEAQRLKALIESADGVHTLEGDDLLRALKADRPCDSKSCKVGGGGGAEASVCKLRNWAARKVLLAANTQQRLCKGLCLVAVFAAAAACHTCSCLPTPFAGPPTARNRLRLRCGRSPTCTNASQGKTGNPNCLCSLVPAPDSYRKAGLWARQVRQ